MEPAIASVIIIAAFLIAGTIIGVYVAHRDLTVVQQNQTVAHRDLMAVQQELAAIRVEMRALQE